MDPIVAVVIPPIPFDSFRVCVFSRHRKTEVAYTGISVAYGEAFLDLPSSSHTNPVLGRFAGVSRHTVPGRSVGTTVWHSGFTGHNPEGRDDILPGNFHGTFHPSLDPHIRSGEFSYASYELR